MSRNLLVLAALAVLLPERWSGSPGGGPGDRKDGPFHGVADGGVGAVTGPEKASATSTGPMVSTEPNAPARPRAGFGTG